MKITLSKSQWAFIGKKTGWVKTSQNLDVVKKLETFDERETTRAIRDAIIAEEQAIKQYEVIVDSTKNSKVKEVLKEIANEERVHVGELQELLNILLPDEKKFQEDGKKEIKDIGSKK
jgi:rubrerythrin